MQPGAASGDLGVFGRHAAEGDKELGVLRHDIERGGLVPALFHGHDDMRHDDAAGAEAVAVIMPDIAADAVEEAVHLALRVVEAAGAGPAIGAAENGAVAVRGFDAGEFGGDEVQRDRPFHFHEGFAAAQFGRRAGAAVEPGFAYGRAANAEALQFRRQGVQADIVRVRVLRPVAEFAAFNFVDAPMGGGVVGHYGCSNSSARASTMVQPIWPTIRGLMSSSASRSR